MGNEAAVRSLCDKQEITEILYRYARALDRVDIELLRSCFHPDSTHDHGPFEGTSSNFCAWAIELLESLTATQHHIGNVLIDIEGDVAWSEAYWVAYHRIPTVTAGGGAMASRGAETDLFIGGRYLDRFERRDGAWKIARRVGIHDWQRYEPANDDGFFSTDPRKRGLRSRADLAYKRQ